jgi:methylenetetrahydrofolate--tRNA-(uracil-5-)-methyltransferase
MEGFDDGWNWHSCIWRRGRAARTPGIRGCNPHERPKFDNERAPDDAEDAEQSRGKPHAMTGTVHVIGAGLAGSEAAWQAAEAGARVVIHEMRPSRMTEAHKTGECAELVCSNSFRSDDAENNAVGLLHEEMRRGGSLIMASADATKVPAGAALAVDREAFSAAVTAALRQHRNISFEAGEIAGLPPEEWTNVVVATGPLTSPALASSIRDLTGEDALAFFDAIAPIVHKETIDFSVAFMQSRYDKAGPAGDGADYINCPMDKDQYAAFYDALMKAEKTEFKEWEKSTPYFEACLPVEVMAERGVDTLRFGPMKPVGLTDPRTGRWPYAVAQLRQDNALGSLWNMVGFQTKLKHGEQARVFRLIPGLEKAEFARLGGIHRNTFLNSPKLLDERLRLRARPSLRFAGQVTGVEGYLESAAVGLLAGRFAAGDALGAPAEPPPRTTALGALLHHITAGHIAGAKGSFQPMNVNFGLFPDIAEPTQDADGRRIKGKDKGRARKQALSRRALADLDQWLRIARQAAE